MGRIAKLVAEHEKKPGTKCTVGAALAEYSKAEREEWGELFTTKGVSQSQIYRALRADGRPVSLNSVGRHHRGECSCG